VPGLYRRFFGAASRPGAELRPVCKVNATDPLMRYPQVEGSQSLEGNKAPHTLTGWACARTSPIVAVIVITVTAATTARLFPGGLSSTRGFTCRLCWCNLWALRRRGRRGIMGLDSSGLFAFLFSLYRLRHC
jgi:hypothetical protein